MNKLHSVNITRKNWKWMIRTFWIVGAIIFAVFNSTFFIPTQYTQAAWISAIGFLLVGVGFGLVYARVFNIKGIDTKEE
jgi:uncharacterized integral membrane protein